MCFVYSQAILLLLTVYLPPFSVLLENGELIKWFDCSDYMREPSDIAINGKEYFVCDFKVSTIYEHINP